MGIPTKYNITGSDELPAGYKRIDLYYPDPAIYGRLSSLSLGPQCVNYVSKSIKLYADLVPYSNDDYAEEWQTYLGLWQSESAGVRIASTSKTYGCVEPRWDLCFALGSQSGTYTTAFEYGQRYKIMHTWDKSTVNGVAVEQCRGGGNQQAVTKSFFLGSNRTTNTGYYAIKVWEDNKLLIDCIPAQNPDGVIGLWNRVRKEFYSHLFHPVET